MKAKPLVAITAGDPRGIGPEIVCKTLKNKKVLGACEPVVIGDTSALKKYGFDENKFAHFDTSASQKLPKKHAPSRAGGASSFNAVSLAAELALEGKVMSVVTAPVSKESWQMAGVPFTGHTEFFKKYASHDGRALMLFNCGKINAALVTEHYSIKDLPGIITEEKIVNACVLFNEVLKKQGVKKPVIAIAALNPHAGDGGKLGLEEKSIITPAIKKINKKNINALGPFPVDSVWLKHKNGMFDGVLFMYHDAALTGLKLACNKTPVHITGGLKFTRTSPVHGTAFDIAGKNKADASGMISAVLAAVEMK